MLLWSVACHRRAAWGPAEGCRVNPTTGPQALRCTCARCLPDWVGALSNPTQQLAHTNTTMLTSHILNNLTHHKSHMSNNTNLLAGTGRSPCEKSCNRAQRFAFGCLHGRRPWEREGLGSAVPRSSLVAHSLIHSLTHSLTH